MNYIGKNFQSEIRKTSTSESTIYNKTRGNSGSSFLEAVRALEAIKHVREHPLLIEKIQEVEEKWMKHQNELAKRNINV